MHFYIPITQFANILLTFCHICSVSVSLSLYVMTGIIAETFGSEQGTSSSFPFSSHSVFSKHLTLFCFAIQFKCSSFYIPSISDIL